MNTSGTISVDGEPPLDQVRVDSRLATIHRG